MKVVIASTHEQEEKIQELINYMYFTIFPNYFTDDEIEHFEDLQVLHTATRHFEYFGTLKEAFQVISSLQTIISIIENSSKESAYEEMFYTNVQILQDFGLCFPFSYEQFSEGENSKYNLSMYAKAANQLLV
ncbi:YhcU family protein [Bacillus seohaeanensis]|uniref:YhcU family protein n=1 Tax=Bacillus seohaeanensis TaxID=284580 RepID=A0ABW5RWD7_9BACI